MTTIERRCAGPWLSSFLLEEHAFEMRRINERGPCRFRGNVPIHRLDRLHQRIIERWAAHLVLRPLSSEQGNSRIDDKQRRLVVSHPVDLNEKGLDELPDTPWISNWRIVIREKGDYNDQ